MYDNEFCKGCTTYIGNSKDSLTNNNALTVCSYTDFNRDGRCPCSSCIVKMMCVDTCDIYDNFVSVVDNIENINCLVNKGITSYEND